MGRGHSRLTPQLSVMPINDIDYHQIASYNIIMESNDMNTSNQQIHISLDAIVNEDGNITSLKNVNITLGEHSLSSDKNNFSQDTEDNERGKNGHDGKQESEANSEDKVDKNDNEPEAIEIISELFVFEDDTEKGIQGAAIPNPKLSSQPNEQAASKSSKDNLQGGGEKPISPNQIHLIQAMASERGKDPDKVAHSMYQKPLNELKGQEADSLIKSMRKKRR